MDYTQKINLSHHLPNFNNLNTFQDMKLAINVWINIQRTCATQQPNSTMVKDYSCHIMSVSGSIPHQNTKELKINKK